MYQLPISLLVSTFLSGLGAGTYVVISIAQLVAGQEYRIALQEIALPLNIIALGTLSAGLVSALAHLGQPLRFLNALANPKSMISQESYWGMGFAAVLALSVYQYSVGLEPWRALNFLGIIGSVGFVTVTSLVYAVGRNIPAWNRVLTVLFFIFSSLLLGAAVCLAFFSLKSGYQGVVDKLAIATFMLLGLQNLVATTMEVQAASGVNGVEMPKLLNLNIFRWIIGLILPLVVLYMAAAGQLAYGQAGVIALATLVAGDVFARLIFYIRGERLSL